MNISYVNFVIERANRSILANENDPNHETYVQKLRDQINAVSYNICLDQEVADLGDLDCDFEIETYLESYVKDLDESI